MNGDAGELIGGRGLCGSTAAANGYTAPVTLTLTALVKLGLGHELPLS